LIFDHLLLDPKGLPMETSPKAGEDRSRHIVGMTEANGNEVLIEWPLAPETPAVPHPEPHTEVIVHHLLLGSISHLLNHVGGQQLLEAVQGFSERAGRVWIRLITDDSI
jgi:hypothetical protein